MKFFFVTILHKTVFSSVSKIIWYVKLVLTLFVNLTKRVDNLKLNSLQLQLTELLVVE